MPSFGCLEHKRRPRSFEQESRDTYLHLELIDKNERSLVTQHSSPTNVVGEERYVTTLITAAKETIAKAVGCFVSEEGQNCSLRGVLLCKRAVNQCS